MSPIRCRSEPNKKHNTISTLLAWRGGRVASMTSTRSFVSTMSPARLRAQVAGSRLSTPALPSSLIPVAAFRVDEPFFHSFSNVLGEVGEPGVG